MPTERDAAVRHVQVARQAVDQSRRELERAVTAARTAGVTWAELGQVLGVTRQAAFKRYGAPTDPRGEPMSPVTHVDAITKTEQVFTWIDAGDYAAVREVMHDEAAATLTEDVVLDTWRRAVAETGNLEGCDGTRLQLSDGTPIGPDEPIIGMVVGATTLRCEAGEWHGRVALDDAGLVVGLLIVPPDHGPLPF